MYYLSSWVTNQQLHLHLLHSFIAKPPHWGHPESFAKDSLLDSRMFSIVFKFSTLHLSLLLRICRSLGIYIDSCGVSLEFRAAHHLFSLGLTPMGWIHQCRAIPGGYSWHHSHRKRGSSGEVGGFGYPAWIFISKSFVRRISKKLNVWRQGMS